ncbi:MAG TPA: S8 family serine peptidase [Mycobacteriales bacterium]|nr:S8 family serine peptidase [Mycobacteriales bacterium]
MTLRPAWSEVFAADRLRPVRPLPLPSPITHDWAFGTSTGAGVRVAVVDSGIEAGHPLVGALQGGVALSLDASTGEVVADESPHADVVGHGTACAGIIRSVAPGCDLLSVRVLGDSLTGRGSVFAAGLEWALAAGAHVINCSLSTSREDYAAVFHEVVDAAAHRGVIVVCAVNNVVGTSLPATFASVISVAAHEGRDPNAWDANPSPPVDFGAPGIEVEVAWRGGGTIVTTGNSFAAPHMTGHVARLLGQHPGLTAYEVKTILRACAANTTATADGRTG